MRKTRLSAIFFILLAVFVLVWDAEGLEVGSCICNIGLLCDCESEESADADGEMGCGLAYPITDTFGNDEYCEISNKNDLGGNWWITDDTNDLNWVWTIPLVQRGAIRASVCQSACSNSCTECDACLSCGMIDCTAPYSCDNSGSDCSDKCDFDVFPTCNPQGHKVVARVGKCPTTSNYMARFPGVNPDGLYCSVGVDTPFDLTSGEWFVGGRWDASGSGGSGKCISCSGKKEDRYYGTGGAAIPTISNEHVDGKTDGEFDKCESACGADVACDEVADGGPCIIGEPCMGGFECGDSVPAGTLDTCTNCMCDVSGCGPADDCDEDSDCTPLTCNTATCMCSGCGDGVRHFVLEECDPGNSLTGILPDLGSCTGLSLDTITPKKCLGDAADPPLPDPTDECKCQNCGDGIVNGYEGCDVGSGGIPAVPCANPADACVECKCVPTVPAGVDPCSFVGYSPPTPHETTTIAYGASQKSSGGIITYFEKCCGTPADCDGVHVEIQLPWGGIESPETLWRWDGVQSDKTYTDGIDEYRVLAIDVQDDCSSVTVETWCENAPPNENCANDTDDDLDGDIDCQDLDCPDLGCGQCTIDECIDVPGEESLWGSTCTSWPACQYDWACRTDPGIPDMSGVIPNAYPCSTNGECVTRTGDGASTCILLSPMPAALPDCHCIVPETGHCSDLIDNDFDGCVDGEDSDCTGVENRFGDDNYCLNGSDDDCDGKIDCADPDCNHLKPDCNRCQDTLCSAATAWKFDCQTKPGMNCSTDGECWQTTKWCNLQTCNCEVPPPELVSKWVLGDMACKIIVLLQGIAAGIAVLVIVYAGFKWIGSGITDPVARTEAADMIKAVFIGLIIIIIALQFINYMFGNELGTISCPVEVSWHNMVIICDTPYMCGEADGVCPEHFGVICDDIIDPNC